MKTRLLAATLAGLCLLAGNVSADTPPSAWDRAQDPSVGQRYRLHLHVEELMNPPDLTTPPLRRLLNERARAELEQASAATSPDVRLRFDLGEAYQELDHFEQAIAVLEPALAMAPRDSGSAKAWLILAYAYAHLDRSKEERDAYDAFLALSTNEHARLNSQLNRAESEMRLGDLDEAIAGYRDVVLESEHGIWSATDWETAVLARWGLAVALDRSGDPASAEHEAFIASEQDPREEVIGNTEHVFFVPAYERDWYFGLGRAERAKQERDPRAALALWTLVVRTWDDYVTRASGADHWVPLARAHLAVAERERRAAEQRFGKEKPILPSSEQVIHFGPRPHARQAPGGPHP